MKYKIADFTDFLEVYNNIEHLAPAECIEKLDNNFLGKTFNYYFTGGADSALKMEIEASAGLDLLFYGSGNGTWINKLNPPHSFAIYPETAELGKFVKFIMPKFEIVIDQKDKKYDLVVVGNSNLDILPVLQNKLKPNGTVIFIANEEFVVGKSNEELRKTLHHYFSIQSICDIGQASMFMFNSVFLPFVNVNHWGDFSLIKIKSGSTSSPTIDLYVNGYFKPKQNIDKLEKIAFGDWNYQKFSIPYTQLATNWEVEYNLPYHYTKRAEIEKRGGLQFRNLCESIVQGMHFYYDSKFISSIFQEYRILGSFEVKKLLEKDQKTNQLDQIVDKKSQKKHPLMPDLTKIPTSKPQTKESWKIDKSIVKTGDIVMSRRDPELFLLIDEKRSNKYIIDKDVILIRSPHSAVIANFLHSAEYREQVAAYRLTEKNMATNLGDLLIPNHLLK